MCDWWYNVDCSISAQFYSLNSLIGREDASAGRSGEIQDRRTGSASSGNSRRKTTEESTSAVSSLSRASVSRIRAETRSENDLSDGESGAFKQGVSERADAEDETSRAGQAPSVSFTGQDENYEVVLPSRSGSARDEQVAEPEQNRASGRPPVDPSQELSRWGRVLGNAIATESRGVATSTSSELATRSSNSRPSKKTSSIRVSSNSLRPNTFTKKKVTSKTPPSSSSLHSGSDASTNHKSEPRLTEDRGGRVTARPTTTRRLRPTPFTALQSSTRRPFRPTIPWSVQSQSSVSIVPETATVKSFTVDPQESRGSVSSPPFRTPATRPERPDGEPLEASTRRPSTTQPVTSRQPSRRPSTSRPTTSRPKTSRPSSLRATILGPEAFRTEIPRSSTSRPIASRPVQSRPVQSRPVQPPSAQSRPVQPRPVQSRPVQSRPVQSKPLEAQPVQSLTVQSRPVQVRPVQVRPVQSKPVQSQPVQSKSVQSKPVQSRPVQSRPVASRPPNSQLPALTPEGLPTPSSPSASASGDPSPPQYRFDRVRAALAGRLAGVEPLDVPADRLVSETRPTAPGRLLFSSRGQTQPEWLYALGGLAL